MRLGLELKGDRHDLFESKQQCLRQFLPSRSHLKMSLIASKLGLDSTNRPFHSVKAPQMAWQLEAQAVHRSS